MYAISYASRLTVFQVFNMTQSYILVEGVNIYANVLDTNQLSVIRGTSFLLKDAIDAVTAEFNNQLKAISTGASSGLYLVNPSKKQAETIVNQISEYLNKGGEDFSLLTFIVESCEANNLLEAKEKLLTQLRIRQMRSLIAVPDIQYNDDLNRPDQLEGRRVARKSHHYKVQSDSRRYLSDSVYRRWDYGKEKKFDFYFDQKTKGYIHADDKDSLIASIKEKGFYNDFEQLAENSAYQKLNNKLAVIYMDGNSFSKKQRVYIKKAGDQIEAQLKAQEDFDKKIQGYRANFIFQLLKKYHVQENSEKIRLETLLWGGDEMLFVVPAWLGFDLLQFFFEQSKDWELDDDNPLTHAAGLVFCHAKTPIANIRTLAQSIADTIKDTPEGRKQNAWGYLVLESIDYPSNNNIHDFNQKYYDQALADSKPALIPAFKTGAGGSFNDIKQALDRLIEQKLLSTRQLYKIVYAIKNNQDNIDGVNKTWDQLKDSQKDADSNSDDKIHPVEKQEFRLLQLAKDKGALSDNLKIVAGLFAIDINNTKERLWFWIYLYELWDYLNPKPDSDKETGGQP